MSTLPQTDRGPNRRRDPHQPNAALQPYDVPDPLENRFVRALWLGWLLIWAIVLAWGIGTGVLLWLAWRPGP